MLTILTIKKKVFLILKTGSTLNAIKDFHGDFEDWIADKMQLSKSEYLVYSAGNYETLPPDLTYTGIVITGSPLMVTDLKLNGSRLCNWLLDQQKDDVPILGICFGHQLLTIINGGSVQNNGSGLVIGSQSTRLTNKGKGDDLFGHLPEIFHTFKTHSQSIQKSPEKSEVLSISESGIIDAIRFSNKSWGVQFHPEFNPNIMKLYIEDKKEILISGGYNIGELLSNTEIIDYGDTLFRRFKEIATMA